MNPWLKEAERRGDELADYGEWIDSNEEHIIETYADQLVDFPEEIYEQVLDDDYEEAEKRYCEQLKIDDVPDDFISDMHQKYLEGDHFACIYKPKGIKEFGYFGWFYKDNVPAGYEPKLVENGDFIDIRLVEK